MKLTVFCLCSFLIGYLFGTVNPAYLLGRLRGLDIRKVGSGNAGASNATIVFGAKAGVPIALFDILKTVLAVFLAKHFFGAFPYAAEIAGSACILGHIFPFYMRFKGGKGFACFGGVILSFNIIFFLGLAVVAAVALLLCGYICVVPVGIAILFPICYGLLTGKWIGSLIYAAASLAVLYRHRENFRRIRNGSEMKITYLFHKEAELRRIQGADASYGTEEPPIESAESASELSESEPSVTGNRHF